MKYIKTIVVLLILCLSSIFSKHQVLASSCNVLLSADEDRVILGHSIHLTVDVEAEEAISGVEMMLNYDEDCLEFDSGSPGISGDEGSLLISNSDIATGSNSVKYMIKFKVKKAGITYIKVNSNAAVYNENAAQLMSVASNVLAVEGVAEENVSKDTSLKSLEISPGTLEPEFSSDVTKYKVSVEMDTKKLIISAKPRNKGSKISVEQPEQLSKGQNTITVIVEAENGDTKDYIIQVFCEEKKEQDKAEKKKNKKAKQAKEVEQTEEDAKSKETEQSKEEEQGLFPLKPISVEKDGEEIILTSYGRYRIETLKNDMLLPYGYKATTIQIDDCIVPIYENPHEKSDFVLLYASYNEEEPTMYQYDKKEQTIQRLNQLISLPDASDQKPEAEGYGTVGKHPIVYDFLLIGLSFLCILFMVFTVMLLHRRRR